MSKPTDEIKADERSDGLENFQAFRDLHWDSGPTMLQLVITAHLYIENGLDRMLCNILPNDSELIRLSFKNKITVASSIGLHADSITVLEKLNSLRNKFAHNLDYKINWSDLNALAVKSRYKKKDWNKDQHRVLRGVLSTIIGYSDATFNHYSTKKLR